VFPATFKVVLDANIIYPFTLRDTLLRAAAAGLYQVYWSEEILDEATRNLVARGITTEAQATRLRTAMAAAFPEALVTGYEPLVGGMRNQEKDRHVAAAAVRAGAQVVVTANMRDFENLPEGLEAQTPDDFLCNLLDLDPEMMVEIVRSQAADLRKPPRSFEDVLGTLERIVPSFAESLRRAATSKGAG
jgi:predicted nucleic acid-binding protein